MSGHAYTAEMRLPRGPERGGRPGRPLAVAGVCALAMAAVWAVAELIPAAHEKDATALYRFTTLSRPRLDSAAEFLLHLMSPTLFVLWGIALVAFALAEDRPRVALAVAAVLVLAPLSAELLKPLLAHPHDAVNGVRIGEKSWPSGHSTAATALAACAVLVAPARWRRAVAAIGVVFVAAVSFSLLLLAWHMPSDVVGGILLAALWIALALAALRAGERISPSARREPDRAAPCA
jgi:membrane-associated phospholipid phosphatase